MCARDQGGAGGYVVVIGGHRAPTGRRKRIQGRCPRGGHLHKTLAEVPDAVVVAVGGDDVDVPLPVNSRTAPRLPNRSGIAIRCRHVDARLAAQIRGVVTQHPAVVRRLVAMGTEGDVYQVVGQKQTGALDLPHGIEGDRSIGARFRARPGHLRAQRNRTIDALAASGQVERVQVKDRRAAFQSVRHHVEDATWQVDEMQRTETGIATLKSQLAAHKNSLSKLIDTEKATLASLTTPQQQAVVVSNTIGANGSSAPASPPVQYSGLTSTQAEKAVAFVYAQLGCPYVYGGTGPCHSGFDCSGLAQAAWAYAGVAIPRDSYGQWAGLPHVSVSSIEPGDLLIYDGEGHVAMYVGGGYIIDAPQTGMDVEKIPMNTAWYASSLDGVVRP